MTGPQLKALRIQRDLTQPQLAEFLGDTTASTVSKWEKDTHPIPQWVEDKMLSSTTLSLPLDMLQQIMTYATAHQTDFAGLLTRALRAYLNPPTAMPAPSEPYIADPANPRPEPKAAEEPPA